MNIPITDKFWCQSKHDDNFNEISYRDNKGVSYEYIDPVTCELKFYKSNNIDISQEQLDNIKEINSVDEIENIFCKLFSNLVLIKLTTHPNSLFLMKNNSIIVQYNSEENQVWIHGLKIWDHFIHERLPVDYKYARDILNIKLEKYFKIIDGEYIRARFKIPIWKKIEKKISCRKYQ